MKKAFSVNFFKNLAFGDSISQTFDLNMRGQRFKLKSILFDVQFQYTVSNLRIPPDATTTQWYYLLINVVNPGNLSALFENFSDPLALAYSGNGFMLTSPGQIIFDSFDVSETLQFQYLGANKEAALTVMHNISIVAEVETIGETH